MLLLVGMGVNPPGDISVTSVDAVKDCDRVFLERYTSPWPVSLSRVEEMVDGRVTELDREAVEDGEVVLEAAKGEDVALLAPGDPLVATTHSDLLRRAAMRGISYEVYHASSIVTSALGASGLHVYRMGPPVTLPLELDECPPSVYDRLRSNRRQDLHSMVLLGYEGVADLPGFEVAVELLIAGDRAGELEGRQVIALAGVGSPEEEVWLGPLEALRDSEFPERPGVLLLPAELHFSEEEFLEAVLDLG